MYFVRKKFLCSTKYIKKLGVSGIIFNNIINPDKVSKFPKNI